MMTYGKLGPGHVIIGMEHVVGQLHVLFEAALVLGQLALQPLIEFVDDVQVVLRGLVRFRVPYGLVDAPVGELLEHRLESVGDGLVRGLEVALPLIGGLNARIGKVLCPTSP